MKKIFTTVILLAEMFSVRAQTLTDALKIKIARGSYSDETIIRFVNGATNGFDSNYDAWKLFSFNASVPNFFTKDGDGDELCINAMPEFVSAVTSDVFLKIGTAGTYSISAEETGAFPPGVFIQMKDLVTGLVYEMRTSNSYTISLPAVLQTDPARFKVSFSYSSSPFTLLNVSLTEFNVLAEGKGVEAYWTTETESNSSSFTLERSKDGKAFEEVTRTEAAGNSSTTIHYSSVDPIPYTGTSFYRLKETDKDGSFLYSKVVRINTQNENTIRVYPNPASEVLHVDISGSKEKESRLLIFDIQDKEYYSQKIIPLSGHEIVSIPLLPAFPPGMYFVTVLNEEKMYEQKIIIK